MRSAETELQSAIELRATASAIAAPKPEDLDAKAKKKIEALFKRNFKRKLLAPKLRKSADKSLSQPWCSHSNTIYTCHLRKTIVLRMQPRHQATLTQPLQCYLQSQTQETHRTTHTGKATRCRTQRRNRLRPERPQPHPPHTRATFHRCLQPLYTVKCTVSCSGFLPNTNTMQHSCSHYNAFCSIM